MRMSSKCSWLVKQCKCIFYLVYSLCWIFSGCLYSLCKVRGLGSWDIGTGFIIITKLWRHYGLNTNHRMWLKNTGLHPLGRSRGTHFMLVGISWWCCMFYARGLGCYPRLDCGLRTRRCGCYPKHISCLWWSIGL